LPVALALMEIDGRVNERTVSHRHQTGLDERHAKCVRMPPEIRNDDALPAVALDLRAVFAHQRLDSHFVETATGEHHARPGRVRAVGVGPDAPHDAIDIRFDVDAGPLLELPLAVFLRRNELAKPLAQLRRHDLLNVGVRNQRGVPWNILQLFGSAAPLKGAGREADVERHESGPEPNTQHQKSGNDEIAGPGHHKSRA
jgi:hypothetical protein